jgi:hypothetical protein
MGSDSGAETNPARRMRDSTHPRILGSCRSLLPRGTERQRGKVSLRKDFNMYLYNSTLCIIYHMPRKTKMNRHQIVHTAAKNGLVFSSVLLLSPSLSYARHSLGLRNNAGFNNEHQGPPNLYRASHVSKVTILSCVNPQVLVIPPPQAVDRDLDESPSRKTSLQYHIQHP